MNQAHIRYLPSQDREITRNGLKMVTYKLSGLSRASKPSPDPVNIESKRVSYV